MASNQGTLTPDQIQIARVVYRTAGPEAALRWVLKQFPEQRWKVEPDGAQHRRDWELQLVNGVVSWRDTPSFPVTYHESIAFTFLQKLLNFPVDGYGKGEE